MSSTAGNLALTLVVVLSLRASSLSALLPSAYPLHIEGVGSVTVVFEAGLGDTREVWQSVQSSVSQGCARTVAYTRAGYSGADRADGPRDAEHIVEELRQRLAGSGLPPPYVLVGHSSGGLYMQYFARRYPMDVQGLVLVDSTHWDQLERVRLVAPGMYRMAKFASYLMSDIVRREIAAAFSTRRHAFVIDSGHHIQIDQPLEVINAARELAGCDVAQKAVEPIQELQRLL